MSAAYRVRARNTASGSENKIHDDRVAARYGFRGGLVPGVTVYGYMTVPVVAEFGRAWLEFGSMQVRFQQPFHVGEEVVVRRYGDRVTAEREDGSVCATGVLTLAATPAHAGICAEHPLPAGRPLASWDSLAPGTPLGTLHEKVNLADHAFLELRGERLPLYKGPDAVAHPALLLGFANQILVRNFELGPWIHTASGLTNHGLARHGEEISVRGRIHDRFERKGHEFVVLDVALVAAGGRLVQTARHTAIYRPRTG